MRATIAVVVLAGAAAVTTPGIVGQVGGGGGGGGGGAFGECQACENIFFGFLHCDGGSPDWWVEADVQHPCPQVWPGSCLSEHPEPCGFLSASEFDIEHWSRGLMQGAVDYGVCSMGRSLGRIA